MKFIEQKITNTLTSNYMPYAMSVIVSRAIPEIDGLKPSHRKLLYTMYKMNLLNGAKTKSANVVGQTMKLNPHGDLAIYETLVRLSKGNEALLHPYIESKGNFGKVYSRDMAFAASRYTEVKLEGIAQELFKSIDKDTVEFIDNYDSTMKEPALLPVTFPTILVNSNQGIAVGMASNICSFNLTEICNATIAMLKNEKADISDYIVAPDFPTGGQIIIDPLQLAEILEKGRGGFKLRANYSYDKQHNLIEISEIPYTTTCEAIIDKIIDAIKSGKIKEVSDVRDETDLNGLKIAIELKRGVDPEMLMLKLFKMTPLEDTFSCNFNLLIGNRPMVLGVYDILKEWISFRVTCYKKGLRHDISKKSEKLHLLNGLKKIFLDIDKAIQIIKNTEEDALVVPNLMREFHIDEEQADFICEIKLRHLNKQYVLNRIAETKELEEDIKNLTALLSDEYNIKQKIADELKEVIKKYGLEQKTKTIDNDDVEHYSENKHIEDYQLKLFITKQGYMKKISLVSLRSSGDHKLKDGDKIVKEIQTNNANEVFAFTDSQNVYKIKIHEIPDSKTSNLGEYMNNIFEIENGETIIDVFTADDYSGYFMFAFKNGKIAKVPLASYATKTNRKKLINAYSAASPLVKIIQIDEDKDFAVYSDINKVLVFHSSEINPKSTRDTIGVQVMTLKKGSTLKKINELDKTRLKDPDFYRTKKIPASGCFSRDDETKQLKLF